MLLVGCAAPAFHSILFEIGAEHGTLIEAKKKKKKRNIQIRLAQPKEFYFARNYCNKFYINFSCCSKVYNTSMRTQMQQVWFDDITRWTSHSLNIIWFDLDKMSFVPIRHLIPNFHNFCFVFLFLFILSKTDCLEHVWLNLRLS